MSVDDLKQQIAGLSSVKRALLERRRQQASAPAIRPRPDGNSAPLSFAQQRLWLIYQLDPASHLYNVPRAVRIRGKLNFDALEQNLNQIVSRHEVLRTTFVAGSDQPLQHILSSLRITVAQHDLSSFSPADQEIEIRRRCLDFYRQPFDLAAGPLLRALVLRLGEDDHVLLIVSHHIVSDGWTGSLLFEELGALYEAITTGQASPLPELPIQYADYAVWQRNSMQGAVLEAELDYWRTNLANAPALLDLPTDHPRPETQSYRGRKEAVFLPKTISQEIKAFSQRNGVTLFTSMLAGLKVMLSRWSNQDDVIVGTVSANRNRSEVERLIGCFMNFLVLRDQITPERTGQEILASVNKTVLGAFAHQDCPFEKLIEAINPRRAMNVNPLYNVALLMQNFPEMAFRTPSLEARFLDLETEVAFLDLRFVASDTAAGIHLECEYNVDLFDAATIQHLLAAYQSVLEQFAAKPAAAIAELEIPQTLVAQAQASRKRDEKQTIGIAATFTAEPLEESLDFWMQQLGIPAKFAFAPYNQVFQQLLDPASEIAQNATGVNILLLRLEDWQRFEAVIDPIALAPKLERNTQEMIDALSAVARRTATPYLLCLCPSSSALLAKPGMQELFEKMESMLVAGLDGIAGVHVVTSAQLFEHYPVENYEDTYSDQLGHIPYTAAFFTALGTMLARRIYSIRSLPAKVLVLDCDQTLWKGVCGEDGPTGVSVEGGYRALQQFLLAQNNAGMILCLCSKNVEEDVYAVFERNPGMLLKREHIVASRINWLPKSQNLKELAQELGLGLDSFVFIDDNPLECAEVESACPEVLTLQLPREASQFSSFLDHVWALDHWKITAEDSKRTALYRENVEREQLRKGSGSLQDFLTGLELKITIRPMEADDLARVAQLTERTNQFNFTTIRRSEQEIEQLCAAGGECLVVDLRDRFGNYGLVGVLMFQSAPAAVEVDTLLLSCRALGRGVEHRMLAHLGEIAQQRGLSFVDVPFRPTKKNKPALDFLNKVALQFREERKGELLHRIPASFAMAAEELNVAEAVEASTAAAGQSAPSAKPARVRVLREIAAELRDVGSIQHAIELRKVLRVQSGGTFVAPRNATEEIVCGIWARLLRVDQLSVNDNFFAMGGHSLLGTQVVARIRQAFGVELPLRAMFEAPTVAQLSKRIEGARTGSTPQVPPLIRRERRSSIPLSFSQQRLWFLDQLEPGNPLYNIPQMIRMTGDLNVDALRKSVNEIIRRHEALRTTFSASGTEPVQVIAPHLELPLAIEDFAEYKEPEFELDRRAHEEAMRPFDLSKGPLVRATLLRLGPEQHILLLTMHHVVSDRWSMGVFADELTALYAAFSQSKPSPLSELPVQYADYAQWQRGWLSGEVLGGQIAYWKKQLSGAPPVLELPTDRPRPAVQTYRGSTQKITVPSALVRKLTVLSQAEGATLFMTLLSAFQVLLARYAGQEDIVVGSPIANRNYAEVEPLIGFFVNTLAFRTDLSGDPSFRDLLARVKEVSLGAYAHQDIPFEKLVEELQPERSLSHNPIFQVLFALQNAPMQALTLEGLRLERVPVYTGTSMFDMSWFAIEVPEGMLLRAEYNTGLFDDDTISRALHHFETLLEAVVAHPERRISELPLLNEAEKNKLLIEFNDTAVEYPHNVSLHSFFEAQVERTPDAVALVSEHQQLTYRQLNERANQLAHHLRGLGVEPDDLVGICAHRSIEMVVGLYGIMKAGGAYVPLDPDYPRDRVAMMIEDAQPKVLLTQERLVPTLPDYAGTVLCLDRDWQRIAAHAVNNPNHITGGENLAYAIYTSGSTGKPKGVPNVHKAIVNRLLWMQDEYRLTPSDRVLQKTPYSFDVSVWEFFWPLMTGACLVMAKPDGHKDPAYLVELISTQRITTLHFVPSMLQIFLQADDLDTCRSLRLVFCSGEALPKEVQDRFFELSRAALHNLYGPTEAAVDVTFWECRRDWDRALVPIGRPIANTQIYLLDKNLQPVPIGVAGELHIGGINLARGYLNRPELTAEKFIADPFSRQPRARLYKTGDLARFLPDGTIEYLGRIDHQVKIRGFRIELGEIEAVLDRHPAVRQSVVMAREDQPGNKQLVAYVLPEDAQAPSVEELRGHLRTTLPEFMVPAAFVTMPAFPLSSNGKVNRRALPAPDYGSSEREYVAPTNETEERIAAIWSEVLHVTQVGIHDDFFLLGGHSLRATQVVSRMRQVFQAEVPLRALFESPTVAGLARRILASHEQSEPAAIPRVARDRTLPLSFAQQRLWFLDQLEPNNPLYNIPWSLHVAGALNVRALEESLNALVERHESLRTTFRSVEGRPEQVIQPSLRISLAFFDLSSLGPKERDLETSRHISEEANRPFNLGSGPLFRATLLRLAEAEHVLLLNIHHIVSDRWSMGVLSQELAGLYEAAITGTDATLPDLAIQYTDFAAWQRGRMQGEFFQKQLAYWRDQLKNAPPVLELPTDRPRLAAETFRGAVASISIPRELTDGLNALSRKEGATLFMTLLAAFQALLARYSGQDDIVVGAPIANRNRAEFEGLIGFFANTLPLRTHFDGEPSFRELVGRVKDVALGAYAHQDMPFEKLVEELHPERSLSHNPLVQVFFALQNAPMDALQLSGLKLKPIETETKTAKGDMYFSLVEQEGGLRGRVEYNTDLFDAATIERMLEHYQVLLAAAVANPGEKVSRLPLLAASERRQLISGWNATEFEYPRQLCLHQLFEQQAERAPSAIACQFEDQQLSYGELNARANQVAHFLHQRGIGPRQRVGIFVERSLDMMVGLLGIQKSGAAYVPLDPSYPAERLRLTLDDAQVPVLLTQQALLASMPEHQAEVVCLDSEWTSKFASHSTTNLNSGVKPADLVYVIFTSGSTGRPKGVQVPHGAVVNLLSFMAQELRMGADDVFPALASFAFDMCIPELYLALVSGGRVVIGNRHLAGNGEELADTLRKTGATIVHATPTTWSLLLEAGFSGQGLKRVIGAEPLPRELCSRLLAAEPSLYNFYGPTETTVWSAFHHFRSPEEPIVVGRPLANTQIYILDQHLQPVPIGVPGEIHIAGDGVTRGYLNRPELTAEKFIADPFAQKADAKMYKTGDLGRYLPDGRIEFQGRADNQVKVRGYRIELGEIETALGSHPSVQECVVIAREDVAGDKRLVGYVVAAAGQKIDAGVLRAWVKERLPEYMVPVAFVGMERLPLSPNGKVDRRNLPAPDYARPESAGEYQSATTPTQEVIAGIWTEVLKLDQVGVRDDFFALGGHSLLATQVVSRIRQAFAVELPLRALFEAPTVAGLAERVESLQKQKQGLTAPPMVAVPRQQPLPLSFAQQRLWFLDQLEPDNPLYNVPYIVRMRGPLQADILERSIQEIVRRHETLRTSFQTFKDEPVQVIAPQLTVPLAIIDLTTTPEEAREAEARKQAMEEVKRPFALQTGPLLRARLIKLSEQDHVLILNTHHIISDRWSLGVLSQELAKLYEAYKEGRPSPLPELTIQYADYAQWQRQYLSGDTLNQQLAYWKQQLHGAPAVLELPTDRPRPPIQTYKGTQKSVLLPKALLDKLKELSRREGVTFFMTMLAAFDVLLSRYSGQPDIVVGSPIAGRNREEIEKLIGFFVNTLVLRTDVSGNPTFRELLGRVRETAMGAYAHQDLPFEKLVEELKPERDLSRNPLFQVMLILQNAPTAGRTMADITAGPFSNAGTSSKFDLTLIAAETADGLRATFEYNTDLFEAATIDRLASHLQVLLEAVATDPQQTVSALPIITADERHHLLTEWNASASEYPREFCLHELFAQQVSRTPNGIAAQLAHQQITYAELHARSNQLAHYLHKNGVGTETLVGVFLERSLDMMVALLGILKAGAAYVPLDPAYPKDRIAFILEDAQAPVLLTQNALLASLPESSAKRICMDSDWPLIARESADELGHTSRPESMAYVLYTSGSTGKPKGVQIEHHNLVNFLTSMQREPGLTQDDVLLAVTTLSFDIAGLELYLPLITGARVVLASREQASDGNQLLALLNESHATVMQATPATWRMLMEVGWGGSPTLKALCGGEALPPELAESLRSRCAEVWNMYGPTETTIWSSVFKVTEPLATTTPIGRPIANTTMYVLDSELQPVPVGVAGELYIGGSGLARGYLNRPELTAEKFLAHPFLKNARVYRTGDLARYLPDGNIQFLGRADFQVKLRGFRIELGEIESALAKHSAVQQSVVVVREDTPGDKRLVAYIVANDGADSSPASLRAHLKQSLPEYMVPGLFVSLPSLPLTPNGKINRLALPAPEPDLASADDYVPPCNATEKAIAEIWQEVLRVARVSVRANFFELGGHSLLATQVVSRIQRNFGVELPLRSLFEHPTVEQLSAAVSKRSSSATPDGAIAVLPRSRDTEQAFPLSFAQQRLFVLDRLEPNSAAYNIPIALRLKGRLDSAALQAALNRVVKRHEVLRTRYVIQNGEPVQLVLPAVDVAIENMSLAHMPGNLREAHASQLAKAEAQKPFDLAQEIPIRASLVRIADEDHLVLITVHHIAFDGWSAGTLLAELSALYNAAVAAEDDVLPALQVQYADYAAWQRKSFAGESLDRQLSYWKAQLEGAPASIDLPTDHPRPPMQTFRGASQTVIMEKALLGKLQELSRRQGVTLFMTALSAFNVLLSRYSRQDDLVVGTPIAGRNRPELESLIGIFVNTLVLRSDLSGDPSFLQVLERVRTTAMDAYANQDVPFERLVEELKPERDLSRNPLFQVMFSLQNVPRDKWQMSGLTPAPFKSENTTEKFDLTVNLVERENELKATFSYNADLFDGETIARMMAHFQKLLAEVVAAPEQPISDIQLLLPAERDRVLEDFNETAADYRRDVSVHSFFEAQAARTPSSIALVCQNERLTYADLNTRANRLAYHLRKRGVGPEVLVAICTERSIEMLIGILGILKAGGAYVPLDPAYPKDRLGYILEDAKAPILLTQQTLLNILPAHKAEVICLDTDWPKIAAEPGSNPISNLKPENLAYVLFTSGSTGRPKGVALEHRSAATFIQWAQSVFTPDEIAGTLFSTSMCFDLSVFEMFVPLSMGGEIILVQNALFLPAAPAAQEVTLINTVPSAIAELVRMDGVPSSVRVVNLAGEPLPSALAAQIYKKTKVERVYNLYGPTEDTTYSTYTLVPRGGEVTIGKPLANTQVYILDSKRKPVPVGVPGELHLAGDGLARGYFGRPDLTAERFLPNPFSTRSNPRMYRTGDLARFLPNGEIQYLGRIDNQVKLRGFRIELGEIESVLAKHPGVQSAVAVVREDQPGEKRLVAYVAGSAKDKVTELELRAIAKTSLPEYMIPSVFVLLEAMPLTPNGKIDRRALPKPDPATHAAGTIIGPRDDFELALLGIWQSVLGVKNIGVTDNFFEVGGHSLLAVRLLTEIKSVTGKDIPLAALFQGATIEYLAQLLHSNSQSAPHLTVTQIQKGGDLPPFFVAVVPGANSLGYLALARYIGSDQPLYKLQGPGPRLRHRPYTPAEFERLAADSIQAMRSVQPNGPYYIGGMCGGARIAFDMARLLEAQGQEVRTLAIFDTWVIENSQRRFLWYFHYYGQRFRAFRSLPFADKQEMFVSAIRKKVRRWSKSAEVEKSPWQESYWPGKAFEPPKYHGRITIFKIPKQPFYYVRDPLMGWGSRTTGGVDIIPIHSEHLALLRQPYVQELGRKLSECLQRAWRRDGAPSPVVQVSLPDSYPGSLRSGATKADDNLASVVDDQADE